MKRPTQKKLLRWITTIVVVATFFFWGDRTSPECIEPGEPAVLYTTQDDLREVYLNAIQKAGESIVLAIYSLSDTKILQALNKRAEEGISVTVFHDPSTGPKQLSEKVANIPVKVTGLMHKKILIVDEEHLWIGSANMTTQSLKTHDNLVAGLISAELAHTIAEKKRHHHFTIGGQRIEYWEFPRDRQEGLERLLDLIDGARFSIRVGMYTWTHSDLTAAIIRAHQRGVHVQIALDQTQVAGCGAKAHALLIQAGVSVALGSKWRLLHHKFVWVDEKILVNGSANWTQSAFKRNADCFLIIHDLTEEQNRKMREAWKSSYKKHISLKDVILEEAA